MTPEDDGSLREEFARDMAYGAATAREIHFWKYFGLGASSGGVVSALAWLVDVPHSHDWFAWWALGASPVFILGATLLQRSTP